MRRFSRSASVRHFVALGCLCLTTLFSHSQASVRSVKVLGGKDTVEIEVEASDRLVPQSQVLTGPDRLVVDFPNALPTNQVRSQSVDRGEVKSVRVGLFQSKPPVTRIVLDLKSARSYQIFPSGRTVVIKVMGSSPVPESSIAAYQPVARPGYVPATYTPRIEQVQVESAPRPQLEVTFQNGLLSIVASKATLSEVLYAVQQRTGADIAIPAGAEQERVVANFEPGPAPEVLARLLNGSNFNFLILSAPDDPRHVDRVILSPRTEGGAMPLAPMQASAQPAEEDVPPVAEPPNDVAAAPAPGATEPQAQDGPPPAPDGPPPPQDDSNQ